MEREIIPTEAPPVLSLAEAQTEHFYRWEKRGRGWQVWSYPVDIEPPYIPFYHFLPSQPAIDDARRPSNAGEFVAVGGLILGGVLLFASVSSLEPALMVLSLGLAFGSLVYLARWRRRSQPVKPVVEATVAPIKIPDVEPEPLELDPEDLSFFQVLIPPGVETRPETAAQFLLSLKYSHAPISFELIGTHKETVLQFTCHRDDREQLIAQLQAHYSQAYFLESPDALGPVFLSEDKQFTFIVDFGLDNEFMQPLTKVDSFRADPLAAFVGTLSHLAPDERSVFQVLFKPVCWDWAASIRRAVVDWDGKPFFEDAPQVTKLAMEKTAFPLFAVVIRACGIAPDRDQAFEVARRLGAGLEQFSQPTSNSFIPLTNEDYFFLDHRDDVLTRQSHRTGMLLNSQELVSLVHLPSASVVSEKLKRWRKKTKPAPEIAIGHKLSLGENIHGGKKQIVTLSPEQRTKHMYVIGASGTGKSTLLLNMIIQDIVNGEGVGVLDPHGDLIEKIIAHIPEERFADVVLFDPQDSEYPIGFNILQAHSELEKNLLSSDLVALFKRFSTSWGDQMNSVLANAILAFLESKQGGTLKDLRRFLVEKEYRNEFLKTVQDPEVRFYWQREFPMLSGRPEVAILTRLDIFLRPRVIRNIVSQKENRVDFRKMIDTGKILLCKLTQGGIGAENAYLMGALLVSKLQQTVVSRQDIAEAERRNFYLYIDEFQNFITPSMEQILSGARKYHLGLILAHQDLRQIWGKDRDMTNSILSNPYTRICFRLGDFDAQKLKDGFSSFDMQDLQNLSTGEAICRIERAEYDFTLTTLKPPEVSQDVARKRRERIVDLSREKYAVRLEDLKDQMVVEAPEISEPDPTIQEQPRKEEKLYTIPESKPKIVKEAKVPREHPKPPSPETAPLGRGGPQHKYLQQLIKRLAEERGYRVTIEDQILGGHGSVDVALEKEGRKIACEISVTSTNEQEIENIQKCLAAGFDQVIVLSSERKTLNKLKELASSQLNEESFQKTLFLLPEEFIEELDRTDAQAASRDQTVRGYKVKVKYQAVGEQEKKTRRQAIAQVILQALKRFKK